MKSFQHIIRNLLEEVLPSGPCSSPDPGAYHSCSLHRVSAEECPKSDAFCVSVVLPVYQCHKGLGSDIQVKARGLPSEDDPTIAGHLLRLRDQSGQPLSDDALHAEFSVMFIAGVSLLPFFGAAICTPRHISLCRGPFSSDCYLLACRVQC